MTQIQRPARTAEQKIKNREYTALWYRNKKENDPEWFEAYRERNRRFNKKWREKNPRKTSGYKTRFSVLERDKYTCQYCGRRAPDVILHVDHIHPRSKGGRTELDNLRTSCEECNLGKSDTLVTGQTGNN